MLGVVLLASASGMRRYSRRFDDVWLNGESLSIRHQLQGFTVSVDQIFAVIQTRSTMQAITLVMKPGGPRRKSASCHWSDGAVPKGTIRSQRGCDAKAERVDWSDATCKRRSLFAPGPTPLGQRYMTRESEGEGENPPVSVYPVPEPSTISPAGTDPWMKRP